MTQGRERLSGLPGYGGRRSVLVPMKITQVACSRELTVIVREF